MSTPEPDNHGEDRGGEVGPFPARSDGEPAVLDAEIVQDADPGRDPGGDPGQVVDVADTAAPSRPVWQLGSPTRHPVIAPWLADRAQRGQAARWALGYARHWALFHLARLPIYLLKLIGYSPTGAMRVVRGVLGWVSDAQAGPLRAAAIRDEMFSEYDRLQSRRDLRVKLRGGGLVLAVAAVWIVSKVALPGLLPGWARVPAWLPAWVPVLVLALVLVLVLGRLGRPVDRPIAMTAVVVPRVQPLTSEIVVRALGSLGIAGISQAVAKNPTGRGWFVAPGIGRDGPGWRVDLELPYGVTASDIIDKRDRLASGLRRPLGCVWPEPAPEHPGRIVLWCGDQDMSQAKQPPWPLARSGQVDLFVPQPFGTDQRGRWVPVRVMFNSVVIGAIPRMGKTFALRELLLIAALDPRAEVHAYDNKGTGDLSALECVAHRYVAGDDPEDIEAAVADLRALRTELRRRTKVIRGLPKDLCPENKVTPELAGKKALGLHPICIGVDECQIWFEHPEYGAELNEICTDLVKRGPAVGISIFLATQRPDAKSLPTGISANVATRYCLKVMGQTENDMVLGTSRYKNGTRATTFAWADKGIGYLVGEGADAQIVRTVYLDAPNAERIALRARALREAAGTLSGHAIGEADDRAPAVSLIEDLHVVYATAQRADRPGVWSEELCAGLAELRPELYASWTPDVLAAALKPLGIDTGQLNMTDAAGHRHNRRGVRREQLATAVDAHTARKGIDP